VTTYLPFILLLTAVLGLWVHRAVWIAALAAAVVAGIFTGALHWLAAVWILLLAALAIAYQQVRARPATPHKAILQILVGLIFFAYALAMGLALLPGFHRVVLSQPVVLSAGAAPHGISVGFPKVVTGIIILVSVSATALAAKRQQRRTIGNAG